MNKIKWTKLEGSHNKTRSTVLEDNTSLIIYRIDQRNGWCLFRQDKNGDQIGESICDYRVANLKREAQEIADKVQVLRKLVRLSKREEELSKPVGFIWG